jgi:ribonucleoside-diphosphate reductase alpha chain
MTAVEYFCGDELAASVWTEKYAARNLEGNILEQNPDEMHWRLAKEFARIEKKKFKKPYSVDFIYSLFKDFEILIPQGSVMSGVGTQQYVSFSNCFVVEPPEDSYGGILKTDQQLVQLSKRRGGVGTDISAIRPDTVSTSNSSRMATGILPFMERFSNSIREVGQAGRRGALMLTLSVHHPQILDFARVKLDPGKVTGANISVRLSKEFMTAVEEDGLYEQKWPVDAKNPVISKWVRAKEVWHEIVKCAHARAEPGLLFWDHICEESPAQCYVDEGFGNVSTNPCSELNLSILDSCRLLLTNLFSCLVNPFKKNASFNWKKLYEYAYYGQRLMDDLVDLELEAIARIIDKVSSDPEPPEVKEPELKMWFKIEEAARKGRRTGLGPTALGDAIAAVGIKYGSKQSIEFTEKVYQTIKLASYRASVDMAKELGAFPIWNWDKEKNCPFLLRIKEEDPKLYADMAKWGRRNIANLTTAPAGSTSIIAGPRPFFSTTSGIEPLFKDEPYIRRKKINHGEKSTKVDFVDEKGDKWTEYPVYHSKIRMWMEVTGETDWKKSPYHGCCAEDLDWKNRVKLQAAAQRHVDHSISSTLNLPEDVTVEKVEEIYETAWKEKCKGITVYRKNCRTGVLIDKKKGIPKTNAQKRPEELDCEVHHTKVKGLDFTVFVGILDGDPYEVFAVLTNFDKSVSLKNGTMAKKKRGEYVFKKDDYLAVVTDQLTDEQAAITRLVSTALRHGTAIHYIVHQLEKVKGDLNSFAKVLARVLKKYIKDGTKVSGEKCPKCESNSLVRQEGCVTCMTCGNSRCG